MSQGWGGEGNPQKEVLFQRKWEADVTDDEYLLKSPGPSQHEQDYESFIGFAFFNCMWHGCTEDIFSPCLLNEAIFQRSLWLNPDGEPLKGIWEGLHYRWEEASFIIYYLDCGFIFKKQVKCGQLDTWYALHSFVSKLTWIQFSYRFLTNLQYAVSEKATRYPPWHAHHCTSATVLVLKQCPTLPSPVLLVLHKNALAFWTGVPYDVAHTLELV